MAKKASFWSDYRRRYGERALPPAGRKALGLPDPDGRIELTVSLSYRQFVLLAAMALDASMSEELLAASLITAVLDDDQAALGGGA